MKYFICELDCDLLHFEKCLASREFWDDYGHEWSYATLDEKLVFLGVFVQRGGDLKRVIERYVEDRSEIYRCRIHWVVFKYIWRMMMNGEPTPNYDPTVKRIKRLEPDELLRLLSEELKMCVKRTSECVDENRHKPGLKPNYVFKEKWVVSDEYKYNDTILDAIEREHWRANPNESFNSYEFKSERWDWVKCFF